MSAVSEVRLQKSEVSVQNAEVSGQTPSVALLTGGYDRPYVIGFTEAFSANGVTFDVIGGDELSLPELLDNPRINFLNLKRDQSRRVSLARKISRLLTYYFRLLVYAASARPKIFHILWNNRWELFDRTILVLFYKTCGRHVVMTVHNVNVRKRDGRDSWLNRLSLKAQYHLVEHLFVHSDTMKRELATDFEVIPSKISVIPFGINNTAPVSSMTSAQAKQTLGVENCKTVLFFGRIAPYKGLEYAVSAVAELLLKDKSYRLMIAGEQKWTDGYWTKIAALITRLGVSEHVLCRIEHVPDAETEIYFKASDVLVLPYSRIFHSGVLFLGYSFGLPVIAADVGSFPEEVVEGKTGLLFEPCNASDLASKIEQYFGSELYYDLLNRRDAIKGYANERYSWSKVADITTRVYSDLLRDGVVRDRVSSRDRASATNI
jgi:glycosyltransferase involved in cell wall biosynthesis